MNTDSDLLVLLKQLDRACRLGFLVVTALFTYIAFRLAASISHFEMIYRDMLGGNELPGLTNLVIGGRPIYLFLCFALPLTAIVIAYRFRRADHAVIGISLCSFGLFLISVIMWSGLLKPLMTIISGLTGNP
jgi:hypothetical protein